MKSKWPSSVSLRSELVRTLTYAFSVKMEASGLGLLPVPEMKLKVHVGGSAPPRSPGGAGGGEGGGKRRGGQTKEEQKLGKINKE